MLRCIEIVFLVRSYLHFCIVAKGFFLHTVLLNTDIF